MSQLGVIEGFYGTPWGTSARREAAAFLQTHGFSFYIYAPKADAFLRKRWREPFDDAALAELAGTAAAMRAQGLRFGVGLSPFEIFRDYDGGAKAALAAKIAQLREAGLDLLGLLFDDMRGDMPGLAATQARIGADVAEMARAPVILCPTYYSDDPVLEKVFGAAPPGYLRDLGRALDPALEVFWTGPKVVSADYPAEHLTRVAEQLRRKPFLWDNYPVNDGARMSKHLHLRPAPGRGPETAALVAGLAANPMNQPLLSRLPLAALALGWRGGAEPPEQAFQASAAPLCGPSLAAQLAADMPALHDRGRGALDDAEAAALRARYAAFESAYADEVVRFLDGAWTFDPACLTD